MKKACGLLTDRIIRYLQSCPKIIHFPIETVNAAAFDISLGCVLTRCRHHHRAQVLGLFLQDTHYRNQFETNSSRGTLNTAARQQWEATLFGDAYASAAPSTRPKYGVVNYDHDYLGCKRARTQYGKPTISD